MHPGAVLRAVRGGIGRRRLVQTIVIALVLVVSTASSVLGLALVADSHATFDHAFSAQRGAHVVATVDTSRVSPARLAASTRVPQVSAAAGPFREAQVSATDSSPGMPVVVLPPLTLVGRTDPGGPVDDITLEAGHWPRRAGQIVMEINTNGFGSGVGDTVTVTSAPGKPRLKVVGLATSVSRTADGWVVPNEISALNSRGAPSTAEMLYRLKSAGSATAVSAGIAAVTTVLPGAVTGTESYLDVRAAQHDDVALYAPFVVAFALIGLVMSVLIVANVVSGAVISGYSRIGILKSIGFTPGQVIAAYTGQVMVPAVVGCLGGVALGNLLSVQLLHKTANVYAVGRLAVPLWVNVAVPLGMCGLVALAAVLPALRGGRLSATQALAAGRAPRTGRGYLAHRILGRLALPRPMTIGLASPFARPARMAGTLAAVLLGVAAVTFSVGLVSTLRRAVAELNLTNTEQVQVFYNGPGPYSLKRPGPTPPTSARRPGRAIVAALGSQPGLARYVLEEDNQYVKVSGLVQPIQVTAFQGDARWLGYAMSGGHWYTGAHQVVAPKRLLTALHAAVGDTVTITGTGGRPIRVRIVGEVFDQDHEGLTMLTDWRTLAATDPGLRPDPSNTQYDVRLRPGTNPIAYVRRLGAKLGPNYGVSINQHGGGASVAIALAGTLTLLLSIAAALGVLNTVVLHTRERVHDLGVFKTVGMTPRQTVAMVLSSVAGTGLVAGVLAVPAGIIVHRYVIPAMAGAAGQGVPPSLQNVYGAEELVGLALAGLVIALAGALLPAGWAAQARTAVALRTE